MGGEDRSSRPCCMAPNSCNFSWTDRVPRAIQLTPFALLLQAPWSTDSGHRVQACIFELYCNDCMHAAELSWGKTSQPEKRRWSAIGTRCPDEEEGGPPRRPEWWKLTTWRPSIGFIDKIVIPLLNLNSCSYELTWPSEICLRMSSTPHRHICAMARPFL